MISWMNQWHSLIQNLVIFSASKSRKKNSDKVGENAGISVFRLYKFESLMGRISESIHLTCIRQVIANFIWFAFWKNTRTKLNLFYFVKLLNFFFSFFLSDYRYTIWSYIWKMKNKSKNNSQHIVWHKFIEQVSA